MDRVHRGLMTGIEPSFERRTECIRILVDAGFTHQLFPSSDSEFGGLPISEVTRDWRENFDPPEGMWFSVRRLLPRLCELDNWSQQVYVMTAEQSRSLLWRERGWLRARQTDTSKRTHGHGHCQDHIPIECTGSRRAYDRVSSKRCNRENENPADRVPYRRARRPRCNGSLRASWTTKIFADLPGRNRIRRFQGVRRMGGGVIGANR
jgi:hypothetical protein